MMKKGKYYTLFVEDDNVHIVNRQHILEHILYKMNMIYENVDELHDLVHEHGYQLNEILVEIQEKKNHNPESDHDSPVQF